MFPNYKQHLSCHIDVPLWVWITESRKTPAEVSTKSQTDKNLCRFTLPEPMLITRVETIKRRHKRLMEDEKIGVTDNLNLRHLKT